jgi:putative transposase
LLEPEDVLLLAGDEVVVTKSGKKTYGLDRFFSSLYGKAVPGLCFLSLSLISVKRRCAYPLRIEPVLKAEAEEPTRAVKSRAKGKPCAKGQSGRPKGRRNRNRQDVTLSPYLLSSTSKNVMI